MNLAWKDIRYNWGRFALTCVGVGMLLMIVIGMGGIYRGIEADATLLIDTVEADMWVVQHQTRGPFAEVSQVPSNVLYRTRAVPGVAGSREFVFHTIQRSYQDRPIRIALMGLSWPEDYGAWIQLTAGRHLQQAHLEMIADESLQLPLGAKIRLGKDTYHVVGVTRNQLSSNGDGIAFVTTRDALAIRFDVSGEAVRLEREARTARGGDAELTDLQPNLLENASLPTSQIPTIAPPQLSAVMVTLQPQADVEEVKKIIQGWSDVSVYSSQDQRDLLLKGSVEKIRKQIGLFRALLTLIAGIIMALILYTLTLDKIHSIALLKLIGAPNGVILRMILQQAVLLGVIGFMIAVALGRRIYPMFPRRVVITQHDLLQLAVILAVISVLSSFLGIWKAMRVQPNEALS
ncbi:MAG: ABC transporter permease [Pirellulaceae bacterium]